MPIGASQSLLAASDEYTYVSRQACNITCSCSRFEKQGSPSASQRLQYLLLTNYYYYYYSIIIPTGARTRLVNNSFTRGRNYSSSYTCIRGS